MTDCEKHLPLEIWMLIFSHIDSAADLAQCSLVFGEAKISKLCKQLAENPQRAQLIKSLQVGRNYNDSYQCVFNLIQLSFSSKMQYLSARLDTLTSTFYSNFLGIVKRLPTNSIYQMKQIPSPAYIDDPYYAQVAYEFRETLEHLDISMTYSAMNTLFAKLKVFKTLKTLKLKVDPFESLPELESVLENCTFLRSLQIQIFSPNHAVQDHQALSDWTAKKLKKVASLTEIEIDIAYPDVVQYLCYRYPNLQRLTCVDDIYRGTDTIHMLNAVKNLTYFKADFYFDYMLDVLFVLTKISLFDDKRTTIVPTLSFEPIRRRIANQARLKITIDNKTDMRTVHLVICLAGCESSSDSETGKLFLDHLWMCSNHCSFVDLTMRQQFNGSVPLYYILETLPTLKRLEFQTSRISYEPYALENWIEELYITYLKIDNHVLPQLSRLSPNLDKLTLHCYSTLRGYEKYQENLFEIKIPDSSLSLLTVSAYARSFLDYDDVNPIRFIKEKLYKECFVKVSILDADTQMICRLDGLFPPRLQSEEEFRLASQRKGSAAINVTCANIVKLRVDLGHIAADINVQNFVLDKLEEQAEASKRKFITYYTKVHNFSQAKHLPSEASDI
ncbi:hypothetical protein [Parasitella parasitica]|uniref:F-box domain-containing protein n=1 Tax=Parasitella parasitica TaxID=35722 RepID=A0A0B7NWM7_9FUNG|nr:hypothetical protein [Parasitella parasitica]